MILIFCADGANSPRHARVVFLSSLLCRPSLSLCGAVNVTGIVVVGMPVGT